MVNLLTWTQVPHPFTVDPFDSLKFQWIVLGWPKLSVRASPSYSQNFPPLESFDHPQANTRSPSGKMVGAHLFTVDPFDSLKFQFTKCSSSREKCSHIPSYSDGQLVRVARVTPKPLDFTDLVTWIIKLKNWTDLDTNSPTHQKQDIDSPDYWSKRLGQIDFTNINGCKIEKYANFTQYLLKLSHISQVIVVLIYTIAIVIVYLHDYHSRVYYHFIIIFLSTLLSSISLFLNLFNVKKKKNTQPPITTSTTTTKHHQHHHYNPKSTPNPSEIRPKPNSKSTQTHQKTHPKPNSTPKWNQKIQNQTQQKNRRRCHQYDLKVVVIVVRSTAIVAIVVGSPCLHVWEWRGFGIWERQRVDEWDEETWKERDLRWEIYFNGENINKIILNKRIKIII